MLTYEDLQKVIEEGGDKAAFVEKAISEHKGSKDYKKAKEAELYYDGENPTINAYEKIIYDMEGKAHVDMWTANHKIASQFFSFVIDQEVSYLLGNGIRFNQNSTKDKLGDDFDESVEDALEYARIGGTSFGFWNMDHVDVFKYTEFMPLYGEDTGSLMAGVRFWQLEQSKPMRATLYELDGYTEYIKRAGKSIEAMGDKKPYKTAITSTQAEGEIDSDGENYDGFPIVPMYSNKARKSALNGKRNTIDALDLGSSNMVNNVDEGNLIYWVLTNCDGMEDMDDVQFIERLKTIHVAHVNSEDEGGANAEAHTIEAPFEGTKVTIDMLNDRLYEDFQAFDAKSITASDMSATAINAAYIRLDMKTDKIERQVTRFIRGILKLAGIEDDPTYTRNKVINKAEETQRIIMQAEYMDEEYTIKALLALNGDIDAYEEMMKRRDAEDATRLKELEAKLAEAEAAAAKTQPGEQGAQPEQEGVNE